MLSRSGAVSLTVLCLLLPGIGRGPVAVGRARLPFNGVVVTSDGKPLAGVAVTGSFWKMCCPRQQDKTVTNEKGEFRLEHPGPVMHLWKKGFQPLVVVFSSEAGEKIIMSRSHDEQVVQRCGPRKGGRKFIGWGTDGPQFVVPEKGFEISGGKPDVDYVEYGIKTAGGKTYLELWFGPYAMSPEPEDEQFLSSVDFSQRNVIAAGGEVLGRDTRGRSRDGGRWRQTAAFQSGARYQGASAEDAKLFDQIVDSMCLDAGPR